MKGLFLKSASAPLRKSEGLALFLVLLISLLGFVSASAAIELRQAKDPAPVLLGALGPPLLIGMAFIGLHLLLRLRGVGVEETVLPVVALLFAIGAIMIWRLRGSEGEWQQLRSFIIGIACLVFLIVHPKWVDHIRRWAVPISLVGLVLPILTALVGVKDSSGARLALKLGPLPSIQTTELIKLALILFLAWFADQEGRKVEGRTRQVLGWLKLPPLQYFLPGALFVAVATLALVWMADFGAVLILVFMFVGILYAAFETGIFVTLVGIGAVLAAPVALVLALFWKVPPVIQDRVLAFLDPWSSTPVMQHGLPVGITIAQGPGYQLQQAIYALVSGGITGSGLGFGSPAFVPLAHSDFIFASIVEELGTIGGLAVLVLFALLLIRLFRVAVLLPKDQVFERMVVVGVGIHLLAQVLIMVAGTLDMLPMTGVTIPFLSQGGTALMVNLAEIGVVMALTQRIEVRPL